jgi:hypothetical protein
MECVDWNRAIIVVEKYDQQNMLPLLVVVSKHLNPISYFEFALKPFCE